MANMVILKRPREGEVKSGEVDHIAATIKSQKLEPTRIFKAKKFRQTSLVTELSAKRIALIPYLFSFFPENNDIKNNMIGTGC